MGNWYYENKNVQGHIPKLGRIVLWGASATDSGSSSHAIQGRDYNRWSGNARSCDLLK